MPNQPIAPENPIKIRGLGFEPLPFTIDVGEKPYRIGIYPVTVDKPEKRDLFIIGASGLDPLVWLRKNYLLADTFFFTEKEALQKYESGFQVGDQETGEIELELRKIVVQLIGSGKVEEVHA